MCNLRDRTNASWIRRRSAITLTVLNEYKTLIANTTADLEEHLKQIDDKLHNSSVAARLSDEDLVQREEIQAEREGTQKCLEICEGVSTYISQIVVPGIDATSSGSSLGALSTSSGVPSARVATADTLQICREQLNNTAARLEKHLLHINNQLGISTSRPISYSAQQGGELEGIQEEIDSLKQCISICTTASKRANQERTNIFEDVSTADDGHQIFVSTIGDLISAKRVTAGSRSTQWLGQMSDESLQTLSRQRGGVVKESAAE